MHFSRIVLVFFIFSLSVVSAQVNSPYSRYGLGNIFPATFGASNGMGGISASYFTPTNINYLNPASYSELNFAIFDVGAAGNVVSLETISEKFTSGDANLSHIAFGFPMFKQLRRHKFGLSFGLLPFSGFQYNIIEQVPTEDIVLGTKEYNYVGDGTLYQVYGGVGYKYQTEIDTNIREINGEMDTVLSANQFSIGANAAQLFGTLNNFTYASFPDQVNTQTTKLATSNRVNGGIYNFGIGYQKQYIRKDETNRDYLTWKVGAAYTPQLSVRGTQSIVWTNVQKFGNFEVVTDTLFSVPDTSGNITLPSGFQGGLSFSFNSTNKGKNQFMLGVQYEKTMWSEYAGFQDAGVLSDSWKATISAEFIPKNSLYGFRLGGYSGKSNLIVNGEHLNQTGIAAGASIPIGFSKTVSPFFRNSRLNLYVNAGQRGNTETIKETYYNFGVGFTLVDAGWFRKYKLD